MLAWGTFLWSLVGCYSVWHLYMSYMTWLLHIFMRTQQAIRLRDWTCVWVDKSRSTRFARPCFRSFVHGSWAELRTTALDCSGIVARWLRRKSDWNSCKLHCSKLELRCRRQTTGYCDTGDSAQHAGGRHGYEHHCCNGPIYLDGRHACARETLQFCWWWSIVEELEFRHAVLLGSSLSRIASSDGEV